MEADHTEGIQEAPPIVLLHCNESLKLCMCMKEDRDVLRQWKTMSHWNFACAWNKIEMC